MHLSLKGSLKSSLTFTYVKTDQALDLGNLEPFTIPDLSGNANTATLYSGIYVSTNGTMDKAINANCSAAGVGRYRLRGKVRASSVGFVVFTLNGLGTGSGSYYIDVADTWQDFEPSPLNSITPSNVILGFNGSSSYSAADFSAMRLEKEIGGEWVNVAHWKLYDSADASLDGYPALDCVGGFHGAHVGCAGGSGEGVDADVAGISATLDDKIWFDGVDDYLSRSAGSDYDLFGNTIRVETTVFVNNFNATRSFYSRGGATLGYAFSLNSSGQVIVGLKQLAAANHFVVTSTDALLLGVNTIDVQVDYTGADPVVSVSINGVASTLTINTPKTGSYAESSVNASIGSRENGNGLFFEGLIYNLTAYKNGVAIVTDQSAGWTVNGNPVTVGQKRETILQTAGEDFNKRMWFGGVDDYVAVSGMTATANYFGACTIEATIYVTDLTSLQAVCALGSACYRLLISASGTFVLNTTDTLVPAVMGVQTVAVDFNASGLATTLRVNGVTEWTGTAAVGTATNTFYIGTRNSGGLGLFYKGLVYNFSLSGSSVKNFAFAGDELVTWTDTIGSNNGTVNGSPSLYHVAESETTAGQDALGTAIENPKPNERVLNLTTGTGYAEIAESASLDLTTAATWELWGNFYELFSSSESLLSKWSSSVTAKRSWIVNGNNGAELNRVRLAISANGSNVSWIGYVEVPDSVISLIFTYNGTIVTGYVNGASVTVTTTFGSIPASMHVGTAPLSIGTDNDSGTMLLRQIGDIRIYNRALTADEVLKNYNARKGAYGL
jgi:hypothetical protein